MKQALGFAFDRWDCGMSNHDALSVREREVALLAARGFANKAIARELSLTEGTIKLHLHNIYQKLGIKSRFALVAMARAFTLTTGPNGIERRVLDRRKALG
jgi:DNA-binding NarL/FixJ family response regulator